MQVLFANTSNFLLTWHFNKFLAQSQKNLFRTVKNYQEELFYHFLHFNNQMSRSMGAWELQGLEFLYFTGEGIEHFVLPPVVCNLLLNPKVSSLLARIRNRAVLKYILEERFELLPNISYKSLRVALGTAPGNVKDPEAELSLREIINLCHLYAEIKKLFERREPVVVKTEEVLRCGQEAPAALAKEGSSLIYRLLELVRLGKKEEAYYLLLRSYIAESRPFPAILTRVFQIQNINLFKNFMFCYIAGIQSNIGGGEI
jgi:CRISPR-associated protein Cst1